MLGFATFFIWRKRLSEIARNDPSEHFDEIAAGYLGEIPEHVRERLLDKKVDLIKSRLAEHEIPLTARGLDLGCGQAWYVGELARAGFSMTGADYSAGQLVEGNHYLKNEGLQVHLIQSDGRLLPFADNSFDFIYSINVIHHILSITSQAEAFNEIVRVLKPGGIFLFHEINTVNPIFRFYMGYLFPLLRRIDQGDEQWILPTELPLVSGSTWHKRVDYFTFLPDFIPGFLLKRLRRLEARLEASTLNRFSAHYQAVLVKNETA